MYYIGISTSEIDCNGNGYTEPDDPSYFRIKKENTKFEEIIFPKAIDDWGEIKYIFFSKNNWERPAYWFPLLPRRFIEAGTSVIFEIKNNKHMIQILKLIFNEGEEVMKYNIYEDLENYNIQVNVAGFEKDELRTYLEDGIIIVKAIPADVKQNDDAKCIVESFHKCKSECEIKLPNIKAVEAEYRDGILYLDAPKKIVGQKIEIK